MLRYLKLAWVFVRLSALNELQYRANFFMELFNSLVGLATGIAGLLLVFSHTDTLKDWGEPELFVVMGVYTFMTGLLAVAIQPNMARLMEGIREGTLDYVLTKPEDTQFIVSVTEVQFWKSVDLVLGIGVIVYGMVRLGAVLDVWRALAFLLAMLCGSLMIYSFWLMLSTTAFWFVRVWAILDMFESVLQAGRYPIGVYPVGMRMILTFLVPVGFAITVPAEALLARDGNWLLAHNGQWPLVLAVGLTIVFVVVSRLWWKHALKFYSGASA